MVMWKVIFFVALLLNVVLFIGLAVANESPWFFAAAVMFGFSTFCIFMSERSNETTSVRTKD